MTRRRSVDQLFHPKSLIGIQRNYRLQSKRTAAIHADLATRRVSPGGVERAHCLVWQRVSFISELRITDYRCQWNNECRVVGPVCANGRLHRRAHRYRRDP